MCLRMWFADFFLSGPLSTEIDEMSTKQQLKRARQLKSAKKPSRNASARKPVPEPEKSDSSDSFASDDEDDRWKDTKPAFESTADYHSIQKLIKYVKAGNTTATMVSLCCLKDFDLTIFNNQLVRLSNLVRFCVIPTVSLIPILVVCRRSKTLAASKCWLICSKAPMRNVNWAHYKYWPEFRRRLTYKRPSSIWTAFRCWWTFYASRPSIWR